MSHHEKTFFQMVVMGVLVGCLVIVVTSFNRRIELRGRAGGGECGSGATMTVARVGAKLKAVVKSKEEYIWVDLEITGPDGEEVDYDPDRFKVGKEGKYNTWTWWTAENTKPGEYHFKFTINNHQTPKVCAQKTFTVPKASSSPSPTPSILPSPSGSPSPTPTATPSGATLNFKARFTGLAEDEQSLKIMLTATDANWTKEVVTQADGTYSGVSLSGLSVDETYDFIINVHPYLTAKSSLTIVNGVNSIDFGELKPGDLNGDNEINGIDWSLMKIYFGQSGE